MVCSNSMQGTSAATCLWLNLITEPTWKPGMVPVQNDYML